MTKNSELAYPKTIFWLLIANFVIGLIFAFILIFFPDAFLSFVDWPISDPDESALFGYRMLGVAILGPSLASLIATRKDKWKEINVTMDVECILLLAVSLMMLVGGHLIFLLPFSLGAVFIEVMLALLLIIFAVLTKIEHEFAMRIGPPPKDEPYGDDEKKKKTNLRWKRKKKKNNY